MKHTHSNILFIILFACILSHAQSNKVGINQTNPAETLDVNGKSLTNNLFLRSPGEPTLTGGHFLASPTAGTNSGNTSLKLYDPSLESSGLFNYIKLTLSHIPKSGITDYDTKIDAKKFLLVIHNFTWKLDNDILDVAVDYGKDGNGDAIQYQQASPEIKTFISNGTWHIKAGYTNAQLIYYKMPADTNYNDFKLDLYMVAYKFLITKQNISDTTIDLGGADGSGTQAISKPPGF